MKSNSLFIIALIPVFFISAGMHQPPSKKAKITTHSSLGKQQNREHVKHYKEVPSTVIIPVTVPKLFITADFSMRPKDKNSPLLRAIHNLDKALVQYLLEYGVSDTISSTNIECFKELTVAVEAQNPLTLGHIYACFEIFQVLCLHKTAINTLTLKSFINSFRHKTVTRILPTAQAILLKKSGKLNALLRNGANPNTSFINKIPCIRYDMPTFSLLIGAAARNNLKATALLLKNKADTTLTDGNGNTALHWAARHGHTEVVELLLKNGALFNHQNDHGETPWLLAQKNGHTATIRTIADGAARNLLHDATVMPDGSAINSYLKLLPFELLSCISKYNQNSMVSK